MRKTHVRQYFFLAVLASGLIGFAVLLLAIVFVPGSAIDSLGRTQVPVRVLCQPETYHGLHVVAFSEHLGHCKTGRQDYVGTFDNGLLYVENREFYISQVETTAGVIAFIDSFDSIALDNTTVYAELLASTSENCVWLFIGTKKQYMALPKGICHKVSGYTFYW